jgi:hypothetical protein
MGLLLVNAKIQVSRAITQELHRLRLRSGSLGRDQVYKNKLVAVTKGKSKA